MNQIDSEGNQSKLPEQQLPELKSTSILQCITALLHVAKEFFQSALKSLSLRVRYHTKETIENEQVRIEKEKSFEIGGKATESK